MSKLLSVLFVSSAALLVFAAPSRSGDARADAAAENSVALNLLQAEETPAAAKRPRVRVPNNYGQLGLSTEQRQRIYAIQAEYGKRIDELEAQLEAVRKERDEQCYAVLSDFQKQRLAEILKAREQQKKTGKGARKSTEQSTASES